MNYCFHYNKKGFTLIETMISVSIFVIVVTIGIGSLMTIVSANKKLQVQRQTIDSMSFALELMSRKIRTASMGTGGNFITTTGNTLTFTDQENNLVTYALNGTKLVSLDSAGTITSLTPDNVTITMLDFDTDGLMPIGDGKAFVRIHLVGTINYKESTVPFSLETGVSPRLIET